MKKWFKKNKTLLIVFLVFSLLFAISVTLQIYCLYTNLDDLQLYAKSNIITDSMKLYSLLTAITLLLGGAWIISLLIIIFKIIFPSTQTLKDAFFINELDYLFKLPNSIRKGLKK